MQRVLAQRGRAVLALAALRATTVRATATAAANPTAPGSFLQKPAKEHSLADINQTYLADANTPGFAALFNARESSWIKARGHFGILVREPAIKVIDHLRAVAQGKVEGPKRVILHGKEGCGKSVTLAYVAHVCSNSGWLVARVPSALKWTHKSGSREPCARDPKRIDQYEDARDWLVQFIALNKPLLSKIVVQGNYTWGAKKESLPKGATLEQLASVYKSDVRMSVDVVGCVLKELVTASSQVPVLVAIDQFNALTEPLTAVPDFNNVLVAPEKLSLLRHFRKFILGEHKLDKGAVLLATTTGRTFLSGQLDETSAALLKNAATFVHLPKTKADTVRVNCLPFTDEEAKAFMAYLNAKGWTKSAAATSMAAIKVLTDFVPAKMERLSAAL